MKIKYGIVTSSMLIGLLGCSHHNNPKTPSLKNLNDVSYSMSEGNLTLNKEYTYESPSTAEMTMPMENTPYTHIDNSEVKQNSYEAIPNFERGYQRQIQLQESKSIQKEIKIRGGNVKVSVESIPLNEFIDLMFAQVLKLNYTVDKKVRKLTTPITLNITEPQTAQNVFKVTQEILSQEGIKINKENGTFFLSTKDVGPLGPTESTHYIGYGRQVKKNISETEDIIQFVPYYYIQPSDSVNILRNAGFSKLKFYYPTKGIQMIKGRADEIRQALELIQLIDRPFLEGKTSYLLQCNYIDASKFVQRIKEIFQTQGIQLSSSVGKGGILLSEIPELNSVLVITPKESWLKTLLFWKKKLDVKEELKFQEPKLYTYKVKYRKADELAETINELLSLSTPQRNTNSSLGNDINISTQPSTPQGAVKADLFSNTLLMQLLPEEYNRLMPFIEKLDTYPLQVIAEVTVAEVTLTDTFSLGFEYALKNDDAISASSGNILSDAITSVLGGSTGITTTYTSKNLTAIIDAFAKKELLNIVSRPKIVILNNETGNINVGQQIPVITSENSVQDLTNSSTTTPSILRNINYRTTGIIVNLTPTINSKGLLTMQVSLSLSEAQTNDTSNIDSPLIVNRSISTSLVMQSGDNILLGGLISTNNSQTIGGVPVLKEIPFLGEIFKGNSDKKTKTELIILIRPIVINAPQEMRNETQRYHLLMKSIKNL